jgi:hypothetical protein
MSHTMAPRLLPRPLARWGDPYVRPDGTIVPPDRINGGVDSTLPKVDFKEFKPHRKRTIKDLPAPATTLNGIACVFMYTTLGLGDREIADTLKITVKQLKELRSHPAYAECFEAVTSEFININSDMINARIAAYSHDALTQIASIALNGKEERNKLRGSMYLMNAGGYGDKSNVAASVAKNDLRIVIIGKDQDVRIEGV